jgi:undecaprenyl pyrophosphate phosphatase UppP
MDLLNHLPELLRVLFLAVLQGVTELFPVSSPGQSIIIPGGIRRWIRLSGYSAADRLRC